MLADLKSDVMSTGNGRREVVQLRVTDELTYYDLIVEPLRDKADRIVGITGAAWNITEQVEAEWRQRLLAQGGKVLMSAALDLESTLRRLVELAVAGLADWFLIEVLEDGELPHVEVASSDPSRTELEELVRRNWRRLDRSESPVTGEQLETRKSRLIANVDHEVLEAIALSQKQRELLHELDIRSLLVVPLVARNQVLGTLYLMASGASDSYREEDLHFAEELARIVALGIDNAKLYEAAQQAIETREEVLEIVAHDLRSPLNAIVMQAQMLRRRGEEERRRQRPALAIEHAAQRMNRLIGDMLDVARLEAGPLSIEHGVVDTDRALGHVLERHKPDASNAGLRIRIDSAGPLPQVCGDSGRLDQVFDNLLGNAIKFSESGGEVVLGATAGDDDVLFWVRDTGPGIPEEQIAHLFNRFWQADRGDRRGAGLGLPIVKGIIDAHGGRLWIESEVGQGTTFFFTVPRASAVRASSPENPEAGSASAATCVLVVEDDAASRLALSEYLKSRGYRVLVAHTPSRALELASEHGASVDVLLTDIKLPGMSGVDLAKRLGESYPDMRILYMSGSPRGPEGAANFVQKPIELHRLVESLEQMLGRDPTGPGRGPTGPQAGAG